MQTRKRARGKEKRKPDKILKKILPGMAKVCKLDTQNHSGSGHTHMHTHTHTHTHTRSVKGEIETEISLGVT